LPKYIKYVAWGVAACTSCVWDVSMINVEKSVLTRTSAQRGIKWIGNEGYEEIF
jgi:hypothetical protein